MWQDKLKEIIYILENSDVNEIDLSFWGRRYRVVKEVGATIATHKVDNPKKIIYDNDSNSIKDDKASSTANQEDGENILSPMPGTFYAAPSPESKPFVKEGDIVVEGDTLCIIEAMKIMNNIEAEKNGRIVKVLVENGKSVEFNQPLFVIKTS